MTPRVDVYTAIDSERDYQDRRWGPARMHTPEEWILYMEQYLAEARKVATYTPYSEGTTGIMHAIRKVTALGVVAMEEHGAPSR